MELSAARILNLPSASEVVAADDPLTEMVTPVIPRPAESVTVPVISRGPGWPWASRGEEKKTPRTIRKRAGTGLHFK